MEAIFHGILLAFGLILPLGAQNVFVFNQGAMQPTYIRALPVILTAALCDTFLIILAVLGVSVVVFSFTWLKSTLFIIGIIFLIYMGWSVWKSDGQSTYKKNQSSLSAKKQMMFAMSVSLLNPHAILDTIGVIGTSSLVYNDFEKWLFTGACIVVSWLWFFGLALVGKCIKKIDEEGSLIGKINKVSALIIWAVAIYLFIQLL
ncbi:MAG: LysE/ArgO family amino acid transporter [Bacillota bacterium]